MKSYSEREIFTAAEVTLFRQAEKLVEMLPEDTNASRHHEGMRCHELARAVGRVLKLQHQDGYYGFVDHTWLWATKFESNVLNRESRLGFPNILDVYSVGQLPMVRLVDGAHTQLPHVGWAYRPGKDREDIDEKSVDRLVAIMMNGPWTPTQSSNLRAWTPDLVRGFMSALSVPAIQTIDVLRVMYPCYASSEDLVRHGAIEGARGAGPVVVSIERLAAERGLPCPVSTTKTKDGNRYRITYDFENVADDAIGIARTFNVARRGLDPG